VGDRIGAISEIKAAIKKTTTPAALGMGGWAREIATSDLLNREWFQAISIGKSRME
jgi:hypothetical protein